MIEGRAVVIALAALNYVQVMYEDVDIRGDLRAAHERVWEHVTSPGDYWTAEERRQAATVALSAFNDPEPSPPWVPVADRFTDCSSLPASLIEALYRMTAHAHTLSADWYASLISTELAEVAYVEMCGIVSSVCAVASLARSLGSELPPLPPARPGDPRRPVIELSRSPRNWVPVNPPGGERASVVEAYAAAPGEFALLWDHLAPAQYIADAEMVDLAWTRGTLSRPQIELVAGRVAALRQCFF